jgi:hypothetical protein
MLIVKEGSAPSIEESFRSLDPDKIMRYQSAEYRYYPHNYTNVPFFMVTVWLFCVLVFLVLYTY